MREYRGKLDWYFETGLEGVVWVLAVDSEEYDGDDQLVHGTMIVIEEGDHLSVFAEDGSTLFDDNIVCDRKTGKREDDPKHVPQQVVLGFWVHWIQRGWEPDDWGRMFIRLKKEEPLSAVLQKKGGEK